MLDVLGKYFLSTYQVVNDIAKVDGHTAIIELPLGAVVNKFRYLFEADLGCLFIFICLNNMSIAHKAYFL